MRKFLLFSCTIILSLMFILAGCSTQPSGEITSKPVKVYERQDPIEPPAPEDKVRVAASVELEDGIFILDTDASSLRWHAEKIVGNKHDGTVGIREGIIEIKDGKVSGQFTIDMTTITEDSNSETFLNQIRGPDFFDIETYPTSKLTIKDTKNAGNKFIVTADLTIMDKTNEITFPAVIEDLGDSVHVTSDFTIDRTLWGLKYGSGQFFKELGDKAIRDEIEYSLDLVFDKE